MLVYVALLIKKKKEKKKALHNLMKGTNFL